MSFGTSPEHPGERPGGRPGERPGGRPGFETRAVHAGGEPDPRTGAVAPPIYQTSTFLLDAVDEPGPRYTYSRTGNPTRDALQECLAALEGGGRALAFASGMAAEDTLLRALCRPGDHVVIPDDVYGGTHRLVSRVLENWGVSSSAVPVTDLAAVEAAIRPATRLLWVETPSNPLLAIADLAALAALAHSRGALLVVDNTFATPYLQRPFEYGADVVVHSTTKYLGGHSDVVGGALVVPDDAAHAPLAQDLAYHQNVMGAVNGPFDAWLVLRGIKTLPVRMERHCDNAERVAGYLAGHRRVTEVRYPGLPGHPGHELAAKQMRRSGGMVSFRVAGGAAAAIDVCQRTRLFALAGSLGAVESLIEYPPRMSHTSATGALAAQLTDLVRLSVGIETADDLITDLEQALG